MSTPSHPNVVFIVGDALADEGLQFKNYNVEALLFGPYRIPADTAGAAPAPTSGNGEQVGT
jgi:hypothetical protein